MHGYTVALWVAAGVFAIGAVVALAMHSIKIEADAPRAQGAPRTLLCGKGLHSQDCPFHRGDRFKKCSEQARNSHQTRARRLARPAGRAAELCNAIIGAFLR